MDANDRYIILIYTQKDIKKEPKNLDIFMIERFFYGTSLLSLFLKNIREKDG